MSTLVAVLVGTLGILASFSMVHSNIINLNIRSEIKFEQHIVHVENIINMYNNGSDGVDSYFFVIHDPEVHHVQFSDISGNDLHSYVVEDSNVSAEMKMWKIQLGRVVEVGVTFQLTAKISFANKIRPATKSKKIAENQILKYCGSSNFLSAYETKLFSARYILENLEVVEFSDNLKHLYDNVLVYESKDLLPFSFEPVEIVFVNNKPLIYVNELTRTIMVSPYGAISIEDRVTIENIGPKLVGSFEPKQGIGIAYQRLFHSHLPKSASDIKLYDELGNNSVSTIHQFENHQTLAFKTRYPLYGGWKTNYVLSYLVPSYEHLFHRLMSEHLLLKIRPIDHIFNGQFINRAQIMIILPENAQIGDIQKSDKIQFEGQETSFLGGLSLSGKPALKFSAQSIFEEQISDEISIEYVYHTYNLLRVPFLLIFYCQSAFVFYVIVKRTIY